MMGEEDLESNREETLKRLAELKKARKDMTEEYEFAKEGDVQRVRFRLKEVGASLLPDQCLLVHIASPWSFRSGNVKGSGL